jgi:hypothetical protein
VQGRVWFNYNLPGIVLRRNGAVSAVVVTASEWHPAGGLFGNAGVLHRGDANIWVSNVRPYVRVVNAEGVAQQGGVEFVVNVDWGAPLHVATTITVLDEIVQVAPGEEA